MSTTIFLHVLRDTQQMDPNLSPFSSIATTSL